MRDISVQAESYELEVFGGDFVITEDDAEQRGDLILYAQRGDWKEHPLLGAGLRMAKDAPLSSELLREIRIQLQSDGISPSAIRLFMDRIEKQIEIT